MSDIWIRRKHGKKTPDEARAAAEHLARELQDEFDLKFAWHGDVMNFRRSGVDGELGFDGDDVVSRRLCDLGFAPGESVVRLRRAPLGGPVMFRVGGVEIVLRSAEARRVVVAA